MAASSFTTLAAALKTRFYLSKDTIPDMTYEESPAYALLPKSEDWGGGGSDFPIIYGHNQSHSANFSKAQTNTGSMTIKKWSVPSSAAKTHYGFAKIPGQLIRAMEGNANAYFGAVEAEVESVMKSGARRISVDLFRDGFGAIGIIAAGGISSATITLTQVEDAKNFEVGMVVQFSSANSTATLRNSAGELTVDSVDEDAGTVTMTANISTLAAVAAGDYIFPTGDREDSATPTRRRIVGFEGWTPYDRTLITSTAFFGVDRSKNKTRLAGSYLDGSQKSIHEAVQDMVALLAGRKAKPKYAFCSFSKWNECAKELGSKVVYEDVVSGNVGFSSIKITGPKGAVNLMADQGCPQNRAFVIQPDTFKLLSLGRPIGFLDEDDLRMLRATSSDDYEIRVGGYLELLCMAPGFNGVINL